MPILRLAWLRRASEYLSVGQIQLEPGAVADTTCERADSEFGAGRNHHCLGGNEADRWSQGATAANGDKERITGL